ncbi:MAG: TetR/AcrR family transcriptional regulator [Planctomycetota bacterium]
MKPKSRMKACDRRAQIVEVAQRCFAEHGYANSTTAKIATMAEVSEPMLYRHFDCKQDLFHEILEKTLREAREHFDEIIPKEANGAEKILCLAEDFPRYALQQSGLVRVIDCAAVSAEDDRTRGLLRHYYEGYVLTITKLVEEGRADGSIQLQVESESLAWTLTMNGIGSCLLRRLKAEFLDSEVFARDTRELVTRLLGYCPKS